MPSLLDKITTYGSPTEGTFRGSLLSDLVKIGIVAGTAHAYRGDPTAINIAGALGTALTAPRPDPELAKMNKELLQLKTDQARATLALTQGKAAQFTDPAILAAKQGEIDAKVLRQKTKDFAFAMILAGQFEKKSADEFDAKITSDYNAMRAKDPSAPPLTEEMKAEIKNSPYAKDMIRMQTGYLLAVATRSKEYGEAAQDVLKAYLGTMGLNIIEQNDDFILTSKDGLKGIALDSDTLNFIYEGVMARVIGPLQRKIKLEQLRSRFGAAQVELNQQANIDYNPWLQAEEKNHLKKGLAAEIDASKGTNYYSMMELLGLGKVVLEGGGPQALSEGQMQVAQNIVNELGWGLTQDQKSGKVWISRDQGKSSQALDKDFLLGLEDEIPALRNTKRALFAMEDKKRLAAEEKKIQDAMEEGRAQERFKMEGVRFKEWLEKDPSLQAAYEDLSSEQQEQAQEEFTKLKFMTFNQPPAVVNAEMKKIIEIIRKAPKESRAEAARRMLREAEQE